MKDIYKEYWGVTFTYWYPITWENRSPEYLDVVDNRPKFQDYMFPLEDEGLDEWQQNYLTIQIND